MLQTEPLPLISHFNNSQDFPHSTSPPSFQVSLLKPVTLDIAGAGGAGIIMGCNAGLFMVEPFWAANGNIGAGTPSPGECGGPATISLDMVYSSRMNCYEDFYGLGMEFYLAAGSTMGSLAMTIPSLDLGFKNVVVNVLGAAIPVAPFPIPTKFDLDW